MYCLSICFERLKNNYKYIGQGRSYPSREWNPRYLKYEAGMSSLHVTFDKSLVVMRPLEKKALTKMFLSKRNRKTGEK